MSERRQVVGWPEYEVSSNGEIFRIEPACGATVGRPLKPTKMPNGYTKVALCRNSKRVERSVHRLVAEAFLGSIPKGMDVCHIDGTRDNNKLSNLRIDTRQGNMADARRHGTMCIGGKAANARFTEDGVLTIRRRIMDGEKVAALSAELGVPKTTLWGIKNRHNWRHI